MKTDTARCLAALFTGVLLSGAAIALSNLVGDPYEVFGTGLLHKSVESDERITKIEYLKHSPPVEVVVFGSSRAGTIPTDAVAKELGLPASAVFNFSVSAGNMWDHIRHFRWMIHHGHPIKLALLQMDMGEDYGQDTISFPLLRMPHPEISGDFGPLVMASYLFRPHLVALGAKVAVNLGEPGARLEHFPGGWWNVPERDALIQRSCPSHIASDMISAPMFSLSKTRHLENIKSNLADLASFLEEAHALGVKTIVYVTPFNKRALAQIDQDLYVKWLAGLAEITPFYNFAYYNDLSMDDCLYYEESHFTPALGRILVKDLFEKHSIGIPVDLSNLSAQLKFLTSNLSNRPQSVARN